MWKREGKRPLGRPKRRWEHNVKVDLQGVGWEVVEGSIAARRTDRWRDVVKMVMNLD